MDPAQSSTGVRTTSRIFTMSTVSDRSAASYLLNAHTQIHSISICLLLRVWQHMYAYIYLYTHMTHMYIHVPVYIYIYLMIIYIYIHSYSYACMYIYIHIIQIQHNISIFARCLLLYYISLQSHRCHLQKSTVTSTDY